MKKPRILALNAYYLPGYKGGGSIRAVVNLVGHLKGDFEFVVLTGEHDLNESQAYSTEARAATVAQEGYEIRYLPKGISLIQEMSQVLAKPWDLIYLNSFFSSGYAILPILLFRMRGRRKTPLVVAPRGELMEGALRNKRWKKLFFIAVARLVGHFRGVIVHATSEDEAAGIRALKLGQSAIMLAPDLPPRTEAEIPLEFTKIEGKLRVVFVSRIDPKKNLHFAIRTLSKLRVPVEFDVVGPVVDSVYWAECQQLIASMRKNIRVRYLGSVPHSEILGVFAAYDVFFLPTLAENNGYVILEALLAGCPVLLSNQTPWRGLESIGVGKDLPLEDPDAFLLALEELASLSPEAHADMRRRAQAYGRARLQASGDVEATRAMFMKALG
jgi:glycosyltransferase involved in cell wall biosynthesis